MNEKLINYDNTEFAEMFEKIVIDNDLSKLTPVERVSYYNRLCTSLHLNSLTKPFEYIKLNGKLTLYATKECAAQLRKIYTISIELAKMETIGSNLYVWAKAILPNGRSDVDVGCVPKSNDPNAIMKCLTKAKRRVTLSICGLGMLDVSEIATIPKSRAQPIYIFRYCPECKTKTYNEELNQCEVCGQSMHEIKSKRKEATE